jgi:MFS family permease
MTSAATAVPDPRFHGWTVVRGCMAMAVVTWSLGLFGPSAYLRALHESTGLSVSLISSAITTHFLVAACAQMLVGSAIDRLGPGRVLPFGACAMAAGVTGIGYAQAPWHLFAAFAVLGIGWACLSSTAISTTLSPWFERHQGRAMSTALLGASIGGMAGVPLLLFAITQLGLRGAMLAAAAVVLIVVVPIALFVLRRRPREMGLHPDGDPPAGASAAAPSVVLASTPAIAPAHDTAHDTDPVPGPPHAPQTPQTPPPPARPPAHPPWTRTTAIRSLRLWTVMLGFGLAFVVQIGFVSHHVPLLVPALGIAGASITVSATSVAAFVGRILLARYADRVDVRRGAAGVLLATAMSLALLAVFPDPVVLVAASVLLGLNMGNVTTLAPIIVRREFGSHAFGSIYGSAATCIQLMGAIGPGLFGALYDRFGGYGPPLLLATGLEVVGAGLLLYGARGARVAGGIPAITEP